MRATSAVSRTAIAAATLSGLATAFDASAKTNVATYWGQGPGQASLQTVCANPNIDIVNIAFVNVFPDQGAAGWPGTNFGNACGSETYTYNGTSTQLLSNCPDIGPDIEICQKIYGTKVFLSIGGGYPTDYYLDSDTSAANFAKFLWGTFGPSESEWTSYGGPRPFGDAVVDGFDFDIESDMTTAPVVAGETLSNYKTSGYASMISTFKNTLFAKDTSKSYYISGAPQCIVPDAHFATVVSAAHFDFLFVQYYNTPECSARQALSASSKRAGTGFTGYDNWESVDSLNADVKLYMGLPASTAASSQATFYLEPSEVQTLVGKVYSTSRFGGIMLWEATYAANNIICSKDYSTWMKQILTAAAAGTTVDATTSPCPAQTVSKDGTCGGFNGKTCVGSIFGSCCSNLGYCGESAEYCSVSTCDTKGGDCGSQYIVNATSSSATSTATAHSTSVSASSTSTSVSASVAAKYGAGVGIHFFNSTINGTATYPKMTAGPFANSSANAFGAVGANANNAVVPSTIYETSTVYGTVTQTMTYSASQGGDPTTVVTEFITQYTTIYPVSTQTPTASTSASVSAPASASVSAVNFNSGYNTGSKSDPEAANSVAASAAAPAAAQDVYVTKTVYSTEYFTVTSSGAESGPSTITLTTSYAISTTVVAASPTSSAKAAVKSVKVTKTIYSTEYFTVTSSGAASGPSTMTLTSTYAVYTTVISTVTEADPSTSATTTITLHSTTTDTTTVMATSTVGVNNNNAVNARPFAFTNSSSVGIYAFANATVTKLRTATIMPLAITSSASSPSASGDAVDAVAASGASVNGGATIETDTVESIIPVTTVVDGAAAPSGIMGTGAFAAKAAFQTFNPKQAAVATSSGDQSRVDVGVVVLALFIGAFFAM